VNLWPVGQEETVEWDFSGIETEKNVRSGSAAVIAQNTSVIFGDVHVQPI
jgi:hypothetical protein